MASKTQMERYLAAAVQMSSGADRTANLARAEALVREAAGRGARLVAVPTALGTLGLSICYDLRFPELYRRLVRAGAEVLLAPSAFTFPTGAAHWEVLCRARATENQCYLVAPDQTGTSPHGFADYGESLIVDPWVRLLGGAVDAGGVVTAATASVVRERITTRPPPTSGACCRRSWSAASAGTCARCWPPPPRPSAPLPSGVARRARSSPPAWARCAPSSPPSTRASAPSRRGSRSIPRRSATCSR